MKTFNFRSKYNEFITIEFDTDKNTAAAVFNKDGQPVAITKSFDLRNDKLNRVTAAAIAFGGVTYVTKVNNKQEADTFINFNTAQDERKKAARAAREAEAEAKRRKPFEYYLTADSAELCAKMREAVTAQNLRTNGAEVVAYYQKQVADAAAALKKAEAAAASVRALCDKANSMTAAQYADFIAEALEAQYTFADEKEREKRAARKYSNGISAVSERYGITAEAAENALKTEAAAAMFAQPVE